MVTSIDRSPTSAIQQCDLPPCDKMEKIKNITQSILALKRSKTEQHLKARERWWQRLHPTKHNDFILLAGDIFSGVFVGIRTLRCIGIASAALPYILLVFGIIGGIINIGVGASCIRQGGIALSKYQLMEGFRLWIDGILLILIGVIMIGGPILIQFGGPILVKLGLTIAVTELIIDIGLSISFALLSVLVTIEIIRKFIWLCRKTDVGTKCLKQVEIMKKGRDLTCAERQNILQELYGKELYDKKLSDIELQQLMLDQTNQEEAHIGPDTSFALSQMKINMIEWVKCEQELEEYRRCQTSSLAQQYQNAITFVSPASMSALPCHTLINGNNVPEAIQTILELRLEGAGQLIPQLEKIQKTYNESQMHIDQLEKRSSQYQTQVLKDADTLKPLIKAYRTKLRWRLLQQAVYITSSIIAAIPYLCVLSIVASKVVEGSVNMCMVLGNGLACWMDASKAWALVRNVPDSVLKPTKEELNIACHRGC